MNDSLEISMMDSVQIKLREEVPIPTIDEFEQMVKLAHKGKEQKHISRALRRLVKLRSHLTSAHLTLLIDRLLPSTLASHGRIKGYYQHLVSSTEATEIADLILKEQEKIQALKEKKEKEEAEEKAKEEARLSEKDKKKRKEEEEAKKKEEEEKKEKEGEEEKKKRKKEEEEEAEAKEKAKKEPFSPSIEVELFLHLVVIMYLIDSSEYEKACACSLELVKEAGKNNTRSVRLLVAKAYFYYARGAELQNKLPSIHSLLLGAHRTAFLHHDEETQATILNILLRSFLQQNLYEQADKLLSKTTFPESTASTNQLARYLYYQGRIKGMQLDYTEAYKCLQLAIRKAPQFSANGFRAVVYKLLSIVQLLMGEVPDRQVFGLKGLSGTLKPYYALTQAVRVGDLAAFHRVVQENEATFKEDRNYSLILRIRHNVIKTGLRKINLAYSRITLTDVSTKLHLDKVEDAEFIVAKAIRDGVIDATIDHEAGVMQSKDLVDIYSTSEPHMAFHKRINFCLNIHNEAVKAMRFPDDSHANRETEEERKERLKMEQEILTMADEDDEDDGI